MTNVEELLGKVLTMEVSESIELVIEVLDGMMVAYQFAGKDDGTADQPVLTKLEVAYDDIEDVEDYCFTTQLGSTYFLHQFEEIVETKQHIELALSVLRSEQYNLLQQLKESGLQDTQEEEGILEEIQTLAHAIWDIREKFGLVEAHSDN